MLGQIIMYCVFIVIFCLCCTLIPFMVKLGLYLADRFILLHRLKRIKKIQIAIDEETKEIFNAYKKHFKEEKNETQSND